MRRKGEGKGMRGRRGEGEGRRRRRRGVRGSLSLDWVYSNQSGFCITIKEEEEEEEEEKEEEDASLTSEGGNGTSKSLSTPGREQQQRGVVLRSTKPKRLDKHSRK